MIQQGFNSQRECYKGNKWYSPPLEDIRVSITSSRKNSSCAPSYG